MVAQDITGARSALLCWFRARKKLLLIWTILIAAAPAMALSFEFLEAKELRLHAFQSQALNADVPMSGFVVASDGAVWMLGRKNIWRWFPLTGAVQKIHPGSNWELSAGERAIAAIGENIFMANAGKILQYSTAHGELDVLGGSWSDQCGHLRIAGFGKRVGLFTDCGVWQVNFSTKQLIPLPAPEQALQWRLSAIGDDSCDCMVVAQAEQLSRITWRGGKLEMAPFYSAKSPIAGLTKWNGNLMAWTSLAILAFELKTGRRLQVVPVGSERRITSAAFSDDLHVVSFQDGTMEWMAPKSRKNWTMRISGKPATQALLDPKLAFVVLGGEELPRVIATEGAQIVPQ